MAILARGVPPFLVLLAAARAQCPPGAPMPGDVALETVVAAQGAARVRWQAANDARKAGDVAAARKHVLAALEFHPSAPALLLDAALAFRDDAELAPLWTERFVRAACDAAGRRLELDAATRKVMQAANGFESSCKPALELAAARAAAIAELARFADRHKAAGKQNAARALVVRWASEALLEVAHGAPAMLAPFAPAVAQTQDAFAPDHDAVLQALARLMQAAPPAKGTAPTTGANPDPAAVDDRRIRAARIVAGLARQGGFRDLQGPPAPDLGKVAELAQRVLDEHAAAAAAAAKVWTIAELEALSPAEAEAFTRAHRDWRSPGVALSTNGRYRVETVCGHGTLLGTARSIELHHTRLVSHYGSDPFEQRQGVVRIVPENSDLETEGSPYWWAGGFQSGDRTTVRFAWSTVPALGRTLTHELTHRFDGVLRPFLPAWYGEGHAQWTGKHYGAMTDRVFVENWLDVGTPAHTWYKGYGDREQFQRLLTGTVADYRDNYFAGYSLYAFLRSFPPQSPRYAEALPRFERNARGGQKDPLGFFTATFCDGKNGRPAKLDELLGDWQRFLRGCYDALDRQREDRDDNEWLKGYGERPADERGKQVQDEPTRSWARTRAEPFFGQDHAAAAALLLREAGDHDGTIAAGVWSLTVDGWRPDVAAALAAALANGRPEPAQAFAALARRRFPHWPAVDASALLAALPRTLALLDALARRADALAASAGPAADAARADRARLLAMFDGSGDAARPGTELPRHLGGHGFAESSLVGYDERRAAGLWYTTADGDLHVGRERPRDGTGTLDRSAHQRDAFVHTVAWQAPGRYVVRGRVHLTTAYAAGAIVLGHVRRDRQIRVHFSSGDFDYATGRSEQNRRAGNVDFDVSGTSERDPNVPHSATHCSVDVPAETPSFAFALHVDGPRVLVEIDGEARMRYATHDGAPIEGRIGFATRSGAIRVQLPTVQRTFGDLREVATGLALDRQPDHGLRQLLQLPTRGVPLHPHGTLVLWWPKGADGAPADSIAALRRHLPVLAKLLNTPHEHPQEVVLAVPRALAQDLRAQALALLGERRPGTVPVVEHDVGEPFAGVDPWVLFVDGGGLLRAAATAADGEFHTDVLRWSELLRARR